MTIPIQGYFPVHAPTILESNIVKALKRLPMNETIRAAIWPRNIRKDCSRANDKNVMQVVK